MLTAKHMAASESSNKSAPICRESLKRLWQLEVITEASLMDRSVSALLPTRQELVASSFHTPWLGRTMTRTIAALVVGLRLAPTRASRMFGRKSCAVPTTVATSSSKRSPSCKESTKTSRTTSSCSTRRSAYATRKSSGSPLFQLAPPVTPPFARILTRRKVKTKSLAKSARSTL